MTDYPGDAQVWAQHHGAMSATASRLFRSTLDAFKALHDIHYAAPWHRPARLRLKPYRNAR